MKLDWLCRIGMHILRHEDGAAGPGCCSCGTRYTPALSSTTLQKEKKHFAIILCTGSSVETSIGLTQDAISHCTSAIAIRHIVQMSVGGTLTLKKFGKEENLFILRIY